MTRLRILVFSATRPARAWRIAERISSEMPDAEICGLVQQPLERLTCLQRQIAAGDIDWIEPNARAFAKASRWLRQALVEILHWVLWFVHGCPRGVHAKAECTPNDLAERCRQSRWPFLLAGELGGEEVAQFARRHNADLIMVLGQVLGQPGLSRDLLDAPSKGLARVLVSDDSDQTTGLPQKGTEFTVEYFATGSDSACLLASLSLPSQAYDGPLGRTLKSDLIADDLLLQAAKSLRRGSEAQASKEVKEWLQRALLPYLEQFEARSRNSFASARGVSSQRRYRSILGLCLHSLLSSPWVMSRNWYRRLKSRYSVTILAHHLVSDSPHRMGISTEDFWRRILFLQRHYRILSLSDADRLLRSGSVSASAVVLTFDDGYCDNFISLRAVAEETGIPVVMFVATQPIEAHQEFDHDLAAGTGGFFPLTWDQIEDWSRRGVEFGSHTRTHFDCGSSDQNRLEQEIAGSRSDLESRLGRPSRFFAFPFGKRENMSAEAKHLAASTYSIFLSSFGGENLPQKGTGRQHLLRKGFYYDPWELELEMQSVFGLVQRSKLRLKRPLSSGRPEPATAKS